MYKLQLVGYFSFAILTLRFQNVYKQITGMKEVFIIIGSRQPPWSNGLELLEDAKQNKHVLPSGCEG